MGVLHQKLPLRLGKAWRSLKMVWEMSGRRGEGIGSEQKGSEEEKL